MGPNNVASTVAPSQLKATGLFAMSEKLCLQWKNFKAKVNSAFGRLRDDKEFTDVTLACEDGEQIEAHKVILASSSPFFEKIFQRNKHPHPLIYLRGFQSQDLLAILDFLYFGEANFFQENLDSFLDIAEQLKLEGLTSQSISGAVKREIHNSRETIKTEISDVQNIHDAEEASEVIDVSNKAKGDLQILDAKMKSMMEKSEKFVKQGDGTPQNARAYICKVCGKEGRLHHITNHIEANHLEGITIPCDFCQKTFTARVNLRMHKARYHKLIN